jgi:uncharacterized membrane protein YphA (DoxX/SURF4 family)
VSQSKGRTVVSWILRVVLAALFILASTGKLTGAATEMFAGWGYPGWFAMLIGVLELAGGIGLLIPKTMRPAILGLTVVMLGAAYTHLAAGEGVQVIRPLLFAAGLWGAWFLRGGKK